MTKQDEIDEALDRIYAFRNNNLITRTTASRLSARAHKNVSHVHSVLDQIHSSSKSFCMKALILLFNLVFSSTLFGMILLFVHHFMFLPQENTICSMYSHPALVNFCDFSSSYLTKETTTHAAWLCTYGFFGSFCVILLFT